MYKSEIPTEVSLLSTVFFVISYAPKFYQSPQSNAIRMRVGHDVWKWCAMYKSGSTILNSLKFINVNSRKAVKYTVTEAKFTGNERIDKVCGGLMGQILSILRISLDVIIHRFSQG